MSKFIVTFTLAAIATNKLATIKVLRQLSGVTLKQGKDIVEAAAGVNVPLRVRVNAEQLAGLTRRIHTASVSDFRVSSNMSSKGFNLIDSIEVESDAVVDLVDFGPSHTDY